MWKKVLDVSGMAFQNFQYHLKLALFHSFLEQGMTNLYLYLLESPISVSCFLDLVFLLTDSFPSNMI